MFLVKSIFCSETIGIYKPKLCCNHLQMIIRIFLQTIEIKTNIIFSCSQKRVVHLNQATYWTYDLWMGTNQSSFHSVLFWYPIWPLLGVIIFDRLDFKDKINLLKTHLKHICERRIYEYSRHGWLVLHMIIFFALYIELMIRRACMLNWYMYMITALDEWLQVETSDHRFLEDSG